MRNLYCSNDNPSAPNEFKYLVCPNEAACEGKYIQATYDGESIIRQVDKWTHKMVLNDVCSYIVKGPPQMKSYDILHVKITSITDATVYVSEGKRYRWLNHLDHFDVQSDTEFTTKGDFEFYITGVATQIVPGSFRIRAWVEFGQDPGAPIVYEAPNLIKEPEPAPTPEPEPTPVTPEEPTTEPTTTDTSGSDTSTTTTSTTTEPEP